MSKKVAVIFCVAFLLITVWCVNSAPIFSGYANSFEYYMFSNSSNAKIVYDTNAYFDFTGKKGESCKVIGDFDLQKFIEEFSATEVMREEYEGGVNYYFYSPKTPYLAEINGKKVNLQVSVGKTSVKLGTPLIYGSF